MIDKKEFESITSDDLYKMSNKKNYSILLAPLIPSSLFIIAGGRYWAPMDLFCVTYLTGLGSWLIGHALFEIWKDKKKRIHTELSKRFNEKDRQLNINKQ